MQDDFDNKNNNNDKIIRFPSVDEKKSRDKQKRQAEKDNLKAEQDKTYQEKLWREQYRAQQAKKMAAQARGAKSGNPSFVNWDKIPPFTGTIAGICLLVHILTFLTLNDSQLIQLHYTLGLSPAALTGGLQNPLQLLSPLTSLFIHAGWLHVLTNALMLIAMGAFSERLLGAKRTAIFYFVGGLIGNFAYFAALPYSSTPVIGASGAIASLFAINMMIMYDSGFAKRFQLGNDQTKFLLIWVMIIIVTGVAFGGIAWQAHLGGFLGGAALYTLWKKRKIRF